MNHPIDSKHPCRLLLSLLTALLLSNVAMALPSDKDQKIDIEMQGKMQIDAANETATYSKNVVVTQGTLRIASDHLVAHGNINAPKKIVATGSPAAMQQQPKRDQAIITVHGDTIEYLVADEKVHIRGNARFEQGGTVIEAASLYYDITNAYVEADAAGERINMVIPSRQSEKTTPDDANADDTSTDNSTSNDATNN